MIAFKVSGTFVMLMGIVVGSMATYSSKTWEGLGVSVVDDAVVTTGIVIGINKKAFYRSPMIRFKAKNGRYYQFLSQFDRNKDFFKLKRGDKVEIIYEKKNPRKAQENTFWGRYGPRVIPGGFGAIIFLIGLFVFTRGKK